MAFFPAFNAANLTGTVGASNGGTGFSSYTKGDLLAGNATSGLDKLGVGADGFVLTADSAEATGLKWAANAASGNTLDQAYDQGGAGVGRTITADSGSVEITSTVNNALDASVSTGSTGVPRFAATTNATLTSGTQTPGFGGSQSITTISSNANTLGALNTATATYGTQGLTIWNSTGVGTDVTGVSGIFAVGIGVANGAIANAIGTYGGFYSLGTGPVVEASGVTGRIFSSSSATITDAASLTADSAFNPSGTITNLYGLRVKDQTVGTNNFAIKTGLGLVDLGDQTQITASTSSGSDTYALDITSDNSGAGNPGGIDMSSFSVDEPLVKAPADAITTAGTVSHQIAIDIGGTTFYLVAYTHGT